MNELGLIQFKYHTSNLSFSCNRWLHVLYSTPRDDIFVRKSFASFLISRQQSKSKLQMLTHASTSSMTLRCCIGTSGPGLSRMSEKFGLSSSDDPELQNA